MSINPVTLIILMTLFTSQRDLASLLIGDKPSWHVKLKMLG